LRVFAFLSIADWECTMSSTTLTSLRELHSRTADGILVQLLWCEVENRVFVSVDDNRTGESFSVEVPAGESALHVFDHPFAYAAQARVR
jgi:hypothetical protein